MYRGTFFDSLHSAKRVILMVAELFWENNEVPVEAKVSAAGHINMAMLRVQLHPLIDI